MIARSAVRPAEAPVGTVAATDEELQSDRRSLFRSPAAWLLIIGAGVCTIGGISPAFALIAGAAIALCLGNPLKTRSLSHRFLKLSVIGLGAGMNLKVIWQAGAHGFGYTIIGITGTIGLGLWLGRMLAVARDISWLVTTGTAICGGSAIAAIAGAIKARDHDTTVALSTVFLLNAVALVIFPPLGHWLGFSQDQFGLWAALAIHDTSSVVGAASVYGERAMVVATTIKLTRALWIVPVTLVAAHWCKNSGQSNSTARIPVPGFILGFLATAAAFTYVSLLAPLSPIVSMGAKHLFTTTLFLIGAGFSRAGLRVVGPRPFALALSLWVIVTVVTASAVASGWTK